ncbi:hypothetical protein GLOIN_2v1872506 [Rhizophagus irregularis DAOM 181602=DAOM 197198]|uniref:Uncharacterized protein n=1 Tax=Rhizophagus irregularis (strain DAOM 181602 / DAOM 197198 / MUCL 43194) TaxID=747089 RepID=A0A2P4QDW4_RHIID|nr:hypothetical protein GLOIN_2v1872506 [Rhizophagus irregularis DAOM 181602=DAOM 197198]POG75833.1 hypothetical protein GLOIN_2v1872506 [Rhizophagus irregularis DAOM 181602=DAOM 197198]|eukprot:XP_025182699.1 hypothetical protein GLOIN_2v1872506 [Rhizophagus irregularis DAOM 181602=DAOM 197198]
MNRNLIFAFLLLAALAMVNAVPYQFLKRSRDVGLPCPYTNPSGSTIYANLNPFPPVSNQPNNYTVEGVMLGYEITPYKTEIIVLYTDQNHALISSYNKALDFYYANAAPFSIDVPDVPTPILPSAYIITVIIGDKTDNDPNIVETHACAYANFVGTRILVTSRRYKGEKQNDFAGVDADKLKLWKAISKTKTNSKHFPDSPTEECIYVLVEALVSTATSSREQELLDKLTSSKALLNKSVYARNGRRTVNIEHPALENDGGSAQHKRPQNPFLIGRSQRYQLYGLGESDDHSLSVFPPFTCEHKELKDDYSQAILKHLIAELEARLKSISIMEEEGLFTGKTYEIVTDAENEHVDNVDRVLGHITWLLEEAQKADSAVNLGGEQEIKRSINNIILTGMQSEVDLLRQHFTELEVKAEKGELEARNAEIPELRKKVATDFSTENVELKLGLRRWSRITDGCDILDSA